MIANNTTRKNDEDRLEAHLKRMITELPQIDACDPWRLIRDKDRKGNTFFWLEIACTERRENGWSNHANATFHLDDKKLYVRWSHGQGHDHEERPDDEVVFPKNILRSEAKMKKLGVCIALCAKRDEEIFVLC